MDTAINLHLIDSLARSQHGLVTTNQLYAAGAGEGWIRHQVQLGRLVPVRRRVFRVVGAPVTQDQAWLAAVLSADADTVLSHESAAAAWGLLGFDPPDRIHLLTTGEPPRLPGVRGHRTRLLPEDHRTTLRRIPVTSAERTLVDASGRLHPWWLGRVIDDALRRKVIALPRLARSLEDAPVSGRRPSRAMKEALAERLPGFHPGGSAAELDVMRVLKRAGISPLPVQQYRVKVEGHTYFLDFCLARVSARHRVRRRRRLPRQRHGVPPRSGAVAAPVPGRLDAVVGHQPHRSGRDRRRRGHRHRRPVSRSLRRAFTRQSMRTIGYCR